MSTWTAWTIIGFMTLMFLMMDESDLDFSFSQWVFILILLGPLNIVIIPMAGLMLLIMGIWELLG